MVVGVPATKPTATFFRRHMSPQLMNQRGDFHDVARGAR